MTLARRFKKKKQKRNNKKILQTVVSDLAEKKHKLLETSQKGKLLIKLLATIPPLFYGYLQINNVDITPLTNDKNSEIILRIGFIIYYLSWVYGTLFDMRIYDISLISPKSEKGITVKDYAVALPIILIFILVIYSSKHIYFTVLLSLFWAFDWVSYYYLMKFKMFPLLKESRKEYNFVKSYWSVLRLDTTESYIAGRWKTMRYYVGFIVLFFLSVFSFDNSMSTFINSSLGVLSNDFIFSILFLSFVISMELWMWFNRIKTKITMNVISRNEDIYTLVKK